MKFHRSLFPTLFLLYILAFAPTAAASDLLVTGDNSGTVLRYNGRTGEFIEEFVATGSGGLTRPDGLDFAPNGSLLVVDLNLDQILEYNGGNGDFIANFGPAGPSGDCVVTGPDGNIYACDFTDDQVFRIAPDGTGAPFLTGIDGPEGLDFDAAGNIYVSGCNENAVRRFDGSTGQLIDVFVTASSGGLSCPVGVLFGPDGNLYVSDLDNSRVLRYNGVSGAFIDEFVPAGSGGLSTPFGMVFRSDGNLYVASLDTDEILRYNGTTGAFIDAFVSAGSGGLTQPLYMVFFPAGELQFSVANFSVDETAGSAAVEVVRVGGTNGEVTVQFDTSDGTAVAGTDYTAVSETLVFAEGETSQTVNIPILQSSLDANDKTVNLTLSDPTDDAELGDPDTAILTIEGEEIEGDGGCRLASKARHPAGISFLALGLILLAAFRKTSAARSGR
ncbi:MAG TPA: Calx-beta domain-containing protein [bacterium]|nr:Calx-beta domain-containing protein [bacterium]